MNETKMKDILNLSEPYLSEILRIVIEEKEYFEGNCFYEDNTILRREELINKQKNLIFLGEKAENILEIGFNAGHSALLFLLSNSDSKLVCFDYCEHKYTYKCYEYLRKEFGERIELIKGNSNDTVMKYYYENSKRFDLLHIDGGHEDRVVNNDFFNCYKLAKEDSIIIWDDVWKEGLQKLWNKYKDEGYVEEIKLLETLMYSHTFGKVKKKKYKIGICTMALGEKYKEIVKYGQESIKKYCDINNYGFHNDEEVYDKSRSPAWSKILLLSKYLRKEYDYVIWIDADTFIMSPNVKIEDIIECHMKGKDILVAQDYIMINTGVIIIKNTEWSRKFINLIYDQEQFIEHPNWEQAGFIDLYKNNTSNSKEHIKVLGLQEQNIMNTYQYSFFYNDCFILHFAGCFRDNKSSGLDVLMLEFCPYKMEKEENNKYENRMEYIKNYNQEKEKLIINYEI
jgi:hypothetical protein